MPESEDRSQQKRECRWLYFLFVFISVVSIASSAVNFYLYSKRNVKLADDFCVPCDKLQFHRENEKYKKLEKDYENGVEICCASNPSSTEALLDLVSEMKLREFKEEAQNARERYGYFKGSQICGHILMSGYVDHSVKHHPVRLLIDRKLSHMHGFNVTKDRIIILTKGKYFVYSQIYFKIILGANQNKHEDVFSHEVKRRNTNLPKSERLLDSLSTFKVKGGLVDDHDFSTKFISGIFELEYGDQLYVVVTDTSFISRVPEHNFIGLFLLE